MNNEFTNAEYKISDSENFKDVFTTPTEEIIEDTTQPKVFKKRRKNLKELKELVESNKEAIKVKKTSKSKLVQISIEDEAERNGEALKTKVKKAKLINAVNKPEATVNSVEASTPNKRGRPRKAMQPDLIDAMYEELQHRNRQYEYEAEFPKYHQEQDRQEELIDLQLILRDAPKAWMQTLDCSVSIGRHIQNALDIKTYINTLTKATRQKLITTDESADRWNSLLEFLEARISKVSEFIEKAKSEKYHYDKIRYWEVLKNEYLLDNKNMFENLDPICEEFPEINEAFYKPSLEEDNKDFEVVDNAVSNLFNSQDSEVVNQAVSDLLNISPVNNNPEEIKEEIKEENIENPTVEETVENPVVEEQQKPTTTYSASEWKIPEQIHLMMPESIVRNAKNTTKNIELQAIDMHTDVTNIMNEIKSGQIAILTNKRIGIKVNIDNFEEQGKNTTLIITEDTILYIENTTTKFEKVITNLEENKDAGIRKNEHLIRNKDLIEIRKPLINGLKLISEVKSMVAIIRSALKDAINFMSFNNLLLDYGDCTGDTNESDNNNSSMCIDESNELNESNQSNKSNLNIDSLRYPNGSLLYSKNPLTNISNLEDAISITSTSISDIQSRESPELVTKVGHDPPDSERIDEDYIDK